MSKMALTLVAAAAASALSCSKSNGSSAPDASGFLDAAGIDGPSLDGPANHPEAAAPEAGTASEAGDATTSSGPEAGPDVGPPTQSFLRIGNFAPDAPASGYDVCLAPTGTTSWVGPLLAASFPAGSLGQGGPNGIQFPWVTAYMPVTPGTYDLQLVAAGGTCDMGVLQPTYGLPKLVAGARTTFAVVGNVMPTGNNAALKIAFFPDETSSAQGAVVRFINALASTGYADVGLGTEAGGSFVPLVIDVAFASAGTTLPNGGTTDANGYLSMTPATGMTLSAHPTGTTTDADVGTSLSLASGSVTTMVLLDGQNGRPSQFLACADTAPAQGALSACTVLPR
jgi:hypothetical protein